MELFVFCMMRALNILTGADVYLYTIAKIVHRTNPFIKKKRKNAQKRYFKHFRCDDSLLFSAFKSPVLIISYQHPHCNGIGEPAGSVMVRNRRSSEAFALHCVC